MKNLSNKYIAWLVVLVCSSVPYLRAVSYGLINLDDYEYLTDARLWSGTIESSLHYFLTDVSKSIWMPLTWISYSLDYGVFGDWYGGFHLHSILIHAINAVLMFVLLRQLYSDREHDWKIDLLCGLGSLFWAVHPLRCESVVLLSSRKDVLSMFWELSALIAWTKGSRASIGNETRWSTVALMMFAVGAMCKPSVMTFPALCLCIDIFVIHRVVPARYFKPCLFAALLALFAVWQQKAGGATSEYAYETLAMRIADAAAAFGIYVKNSFIPTDVCIQCVKRWPDLPRYLIPGSVIFCGYIAILLWKILPRLFKWREACARTDTQGACVIIVRPFSRCDGTIAGLLWFAIAILPMLGLTPFGYHAFADRFTYIPAIGFSITGVGLMSRWMNGKRCLVFTSALFITWLSLALLTWRQTRYFEDDFKAYTHTLEIDGDQNVIAHRLLALWHFELQHDLDRCIEHSERVLQLDPKRLTDGYVAYVFALAEKGLLDKAAAALDRYRDDLLRDLSTEEKHAFWQETGSSSLLKEKLLYDCCRVSCWIHDPASADRANEWIEERIAKYGQAPVFTYLQLQLALRQGDMAMVDRCRKELSKPRRLEGYVNFRWLRARQ